MLSAIVKESQAKQLKIKARNDRNRKEAMAATESVTNLMTENVQDSVNEVYAAQSKLEKEEPSTSLAKRVTRCVHAA